MHPFISNENKFTKPYEFLSSLSLCLQIPDDFHESGTIFDAIALISLPFTSRKLKGLSVRFVTSS